MRAEKELTKSIKSGNRPAPLKPKGETLLASSLHEIAETVRMRAMVFVISDMLDEPSDILDAVLHLRDRKHEVVLFHLFDAE